LIIGNQQCHTYVMPGSRNEPLCHTYVYECVKHIVMYMLKNAFMWDMTIDTYGKNGFDC